MTFPHYKSLGSTRISIFQRTYKKLLLTLFTVVTLAWTPLAFPLDFEIIERNQDGLASAVKISGEIQSGDYEKFLAFVRKPSPITGYPDSIHSLSRIILSSNGGNVVEAMKIASSLKQFYPLIDVEDTCASSCVLLWLSGAQRHVGLRSKEGRIGIHRPTLPAEDIKKIPVKELEGIFREMNSSFKNFVLEQGLPLSIYERLLATDSSEMYWLTKEDLRLIGSSPAYFMEKMKTTCLPIAGRYYEDKNDANLQALKKCNSDLTLNERLLAVDSLLGKNKPVGWSEYMKGLMVSGKEEATIEPAKVEISGVEWFSSDNGENINWNDANRYCAGKGSGWRLPSVSELLTIYDEKASVLCGDFTCNVSSKFHLSSPFIWSNETKNTSEAWLLMFFSGTRLAGNKDNGEVRRALCVRKH